jgi:putative endonuclease
LTASKGTDGGEVDKTGCYCYIVACADGSFYTGWTTNPEGRIKAHNAGRGSRYTRSRRPVRLVLVEPQTDRSSAMRRERAIKTMSRAGKLRLIAGAQRLEAGARIPGTDGDTT